MTTETFTGTVKDGIGTLTLNRPGAFNSVDIPTMQQFREAIAAVQGAKVVLLRSEGKAFSGGGDLATFAAAPSLPAYITEVADTLHRALLDLWNLDAVVVSRVQGVAAGAGVGLAASADIVIASSAAKFDLAYVRVGMTPDGGSTLLGASIGLHRLLRLALLSPTLSAVEAREYGFVTEVIEPEQLDARCDEVVAQLAAGPHRALADARKMLRARMVPDPSAALAQETTYITRQAYGPGGDEGIRAFLEKRKPNFA